jgi:nucleoside diphosphate kinase
MLHWPTTVLFLEGNDAIETWRKNVGAEWRLKVLKTSRYYGTLRSLFQGSEHNTVFHSSDSKKNLIREIGLLRDFFIEQRNLLSRDTES